jgi:nucleoid DNA-binding protein
MNPKNHKKFRKDIATELNIHENVVEDFIAFYYGKVRKALSSLDHPNIFVEGLGTFKIRKARLDKSIKAYKSKLGEFENNTYKGYDRTISMKAKILKMEELKDKIQANIVAKQEFKKKRNGAE